MIKFKDLSGALKTAVVFAYIAGITFTVGFVVGFIEGLFGIY